MRDLYFLTCRLGAGEGWGHDRIETAENL